MTGTLALSVNFSPDYVPEGAIIVCRECRTYQGDLLPEDPDFAYSFHKPGCSVGARSTNVRWRSP